jgi:hypothetical protein
MKFSDESPRRQVNIRLEYPFYNFLKGEAEFNHITITELIKYYAIKGFGFEKFKKIIERQRRNSNE